MKTSTITISPYTDKLCYEARLVAIKAHGDQSYDGIFPYEKHLHDVVQVLKRFGFTGVYEICGWLHDSIEDGNVSYNKLKSYFGEEVAEAVFAVTDELGRNRIERKEKTYPKIFRNKLAQVVKVADRIANIEHGGKVDMYKKEHNSFKQSIHIEGVCDELWQYLEFLIFRENG